ncbi:M48 family metallopeptidase [Chloroflexota bacterium]
MANIVTVKINDVGTVLFERSKRAKRVIIYVKPFNEVRVAVPYRLSFNKAMEFVHTKTDWIKIRLEKFKQYEYEYNLRSGVNETVDKEKARKVLTRRLKQLADKYGFVYNTVSFRNQKTRWGSCSSQNNISLNIKLITLPDELIDYVILHELIHTREKNHGKAFWAEMDKIMGNGKKMTLKLRKYGIGLY